MTHAVRIHAPGGPEAMRWESVPTPEPGPGEALIRHGAVGLNYIDVYFRTGLYRPRRCRWSWARKARAPCSPSARA